MNLTRTLDAVLGTLERVTGASRIGDETLYALVLFGSGAVVGSGVTVLLIHFLTGWQ